MNKNVFVSIIIPVYNTPEPLLKSCFNSVRNQTNSNWELIVVDDGSSRNCSDFLDSFCQTLPNTKIIHKKNGGVSSARNMAINEAQGEWVIFLDSDNTIPLDAVQIYYDTIKKFGNEKTDMVVGFCKRGNRIIENNMDVITLDSDIHEVSKATCEMEVIKDKNELVNHLITNRVERWICQTVYFADGPVSKLVRNKLTKRIQFPIELKWDEDAVWLLNYIAVCNEIILIPDVVYNTIDFEFSATRKYRPECVKEFFKVCESEQKLMSIFPLCKNAISYRRFQNILLVARLNFFHKDNPLSKKIRYKEFKDWCRHDGTKSVAKDVIKNLREFNKREIIFKIYSICLLFRQYKMCWLLLSIYGRRR